MNQTPIENITPYEKNQKLHPKKQIEQVAASIKEFGFNQPVVVDKNNIIIVGHGRYEAAKLLGMEQVPVLQVDLSDKQAKAYRLADNKLNESDWDMELVVEELKGLDEPMIELTGFDKDLILEADEKDDEVPEVDEKGEPTAKLGDIWKLGEHRVMCGSATSFEDIETLMNGEKPDLIHTDPPYGMNAVSKSGVLSKNYDGDIMGDDNPDVAKDSFNLIYGMYPEAKQIWWGANYYSSVLPDSECWLVWDKNNGESDQTDCELAWANFRSVVRQFTQSSEKTNRVHPTQKPVDLVGWIMRRFKFDNKIVADFFGGSGSTLIAAEKYEKIAYVMELDPKYVDVIIKRWEDYTGNKAELITDKNG